MVGNDIQADEASQCKNAPGMNGGYTFLLGLTCGFAVSLLLVLVFAAQSASCQPQVVPARQMAVPLEEFLRKSSVTQEVFWPTDERFFDAFLLIICFVFSAYAAGLVPDMLPAKEKTSEHDTEACKICYYMSKATSLPEIESKINRKICFRCPITLEIMRDPVICADGHSYERLAIEHWLRKYERSPQTNLPLSSPELIPNHSLRGAIHEAGLSVLLSSTSKN
mmetsp:Transcript_913/g.1257  ORF Transcript_913/g.1257 Transcript_913/m.1257 type:complete len:223 (+) Transcript_913:49-717(+)